MFLTTPVVLAAGDPLNFTKDAVAEATRDGAPAIDLIDGELLVNKLKELSLGVKTEIIQVEKVAIDKDWLLSV